VLYIVLVLAEICACVSRFRCPFISQECAESFSHSFSTIIFFVVFFFFIFSQLAVNSFYAARSFFSLFGGQMVTGFNGFGSGRRQRIAQF